jgi:hypothetical protein
MKLLFVFGIGGTGSRVVEALVYLLAAGVHLRNETGDPVELIPILLDTDASNRDTLDCVAALELYQSLHVQCASPGHDGFFATSIQSLASLSDNPSGEISKSFRLSYQGVENVTFRQFIGFDQISDPRTKYLLQALYSDENMNDKLTGGFLGNPNIGAVVLSGFKDTADFKLFATSFAPGDRIFVINSIFGGTGAAGLPWLQKALRSQEQNTGAANAIRNAAIGAVTVLPYFKLQDDENSRIDSNVFITKTKAALSYYHQHIRLNALYYLADTLQTTYANHESGENQSNAAHLIELLGALAVFNFARIPDKELKDTSLYHEFAIESDSEVLDFSSLGPKTSGVFARQLTQLQILALLNRGHLNQSTHQPWARENGFNASFFNSPEYSSVGKFLNNYFSVWIQQLANNRRGFAPFDLSTKPHDMTRLRNDHPLDRHWFVPRLSAENLDMQANGFKKINDGNSGSGKRFSRLWWHATDAMYRQVYKDYQE